MNNNIATAPSTPPPSWFAELVAAKRKLEFSDSLAIDAPHKKGRNNTNTTTNNANAAVKSNDDAEKKEEEEEVPSPPTIGHTLDDPLAFLRNPLLHINTEKLTDVELQLLLQAEVLGRIGGEFFRCHHGLGQTTSRGCGRKKKKGGAANPKPPVDKSPQYFPSPFLVKTTKTDIGDEGVVEPSDVITKFEATLRHHGYEHGLQELLDHPTHYAIGMKRVVAFSPLKDSGSPSEATAAEKSEGTKSQTASAHGFDDDAILASLRSLLATGYTAADQVSTALAANVEAKRFDEMEKVRVAAAIEEHKKLKEAEEKRIAEEQRIADEKAKAAAEAAAAAAKEEKEEEAATPAATTTPAPSKAKKRRAKKKNPSSSTGPSTTHRQFTSGFTTNDASSVTEKLDAAPTLYFGNASTCAMIPSNQTATLFHPGCGEHGTLQFAAITLILLKDKKGTAIPNVVAGGSMHSSMGQLSTEYCVTHRLQSTGTGGGNNAQTHDDATDDHLIVYMPIGLAATFEAMERAVAPFRPLPPGKKKSADVATTAKKKKQTQKKKDKKKNKQSKSAAAAAPPAVSAS